jgi:hypothetical protein
MHRRVKQFTPLPSLSALRSGEAAPLGEAASFSPGLLQAPIPSGTDGTMTWLEILLVVALLLIALGLTR